MKNIFVLSIFALTNLAVNAALAESDFLATSSLTFKSVDLDQTAINAMNHLKQVFQYYTPALDSTTKLVKPLVVSGPDQSPTITFSIQKCVAVYCKQANIEGNIEAREISGNCDRKWHLVTDLARSDKIVADTYNTLEIFVCFKKDKASEQGQMSFEGYAGHGPKYARGMYQSTMFDFLKMQVNPMTDAFRKHIEREALSLP